jgi:hypothetical protein
VTKPKTACKLARALDRDEHKRAGPPPWQRWGFAAIPAAALIELGAHVVQTHSVVRDADWRAARAYVASQVKADDLVTFAPGWVDPIGREQFGDEIATLEREGRPDETRFPRAFEVSIRGAHTPALATWARGGEQRFGDVTVTTLENPAPARVLEDLVSLVSPERLRVSHVDGDHESPCAFSRGSGQSGGLGFGPAIPGERFSCPGGALVGASVMADLTYRPRRCIFAPVAGGKGFVRLRFLDVKIGRTLHGHHGIYVEAERNRTGAPVTITFKVGDALVGSVVHHDGDGWKPFEFDTSEIHGDEKNGGAADPRADVVAEIASPNADRRTYCFEADTR